METTSASAPDQGYGDTEELMAAYGIECVPVEYFHWNGYRYTTFKEALAAAKRASPAGSIAGA